MAANIQPVKPKAGEPVTGLWKQVEILINVVKALQVDISSIKARIGGRRRMDGAGGGGDAPVWL